MVHTIEQEILALEERLADAKRTLDLEALDRFYADDLLMTGVLGEPTCTKAAIMDEARRGIAQRDAASHGPALEVALRNEDLKVVAHGDTGIASYRFVLSVKGANDGIERRYRTTNVWRKREGRWRIVAAHTAFVLDAAQAAGLLGEADA